MTDRETVLKKIAEIHVEQVEKACIEVAEYYRKEESFKRTFALVCGVAAALAVAGMNEAWTLPFTLGAASYALLRR